MSSVLARPKSLNTVSQYYFPLFIILIVPRSFSCSIQSFISVSRKDACKSIRFVSREEWKARTPVRTAPIALPVSHIIIIHSVFGACKTTPQCIRNMQLIQDYHLDDKGWSDIAYNFLIGGDGLVYIGKGWRQIGEHTINYNTISIGIAFMGNFTLLQPSPGMINAAKKLIKCGIQKGYLTPLSEIHGHKDATCTDSPGENLYAVIKQWNNFIGGKLPMYYCSNSYVETTQVMHKPELDE